MDITEIMKKAIIKFKTRIYENEILYIESENSLLQINAYLMTNVDNIKRIDFYEKEV